MKDGVFVDFTAEHPLSDAAFRAGWGSAPARGMTAQWAKKVKVGVKTIFYPHKKARARCHTCGRIHSESEHRGHAFAGKSKTFGVPGKKLSPQIATALAAAASVPMPRVPRAARAAKAPKHVASPRAHRKPRAAKAAACACSAPRSVRVMNPNGMNWQTVPSMRAPSAKPRRAPKCIVGPGGATYCQVPERQPATRRSQRHKRPRGRADTGATINPRQRIEINEPAPKSSRRKAKAKGNATHKPGCGCPFCVRDRDTKRPRRVRIAV